MCLPGVVVRGCRRCGAGTEAARVLLLDVEIDLRVPGNRNHHIGRYKHNIRKHRVAHNLMIPRTGNWRYVYA